MKVKFSEGNKRRMADVAENLRGTCQSLDDALSAEFGEGVELQDVDIELLQELDDIVMLCEECGWWCETSEMSANAPSICAECDGEEDED